MGIVSRDDHSFTFTPAAGTHRRHVSLLIGLPVVLGCAAIGYVLGFALPLRLLFADTQIAEPPPELSLSSIRLVDEVPAIAPKAPSADLPTRPEKPAAVGTHQQPAAVVGTAARTSTEPEVSRPEASERILNRNHRAAARSKKLRHLMARRVARPWKPKTSELESFFGVPK